MQFHMPVVKRTVAVAALSAVASFSAQADLTTTAQSTATLTSATANDSSNAVGSVAISPNVTGSFSFAAFDSSIGVLTGASFGVAFSGSPTLTSSNGNAQGSVTYKETASLAGFGTATSSTSEARTGNTGATTPLAAYGATTVANLNSLVGSGTLASSVVGTATADRTSGSAGLSATSSAHSTVGTLTYNYLNHAGASFSSTADSNALSITAGSSFNVYAVTGANRTLLDQITGWTCVSGCTGFTMTWGPNISDMVAGGSMTGTVTSTSGGTAVYHATFGDNTSYGASASMVTEDLELTVTDVPEPGSMALFLAGIAALGAVSRRRGLSK